MFKVPMKYKKHIAAYFKGFFLFGIIFFSFWRYSRFSILQMRKVMTSQVVPRKQHNTQSRMTVEVLKQFSSNLAPAMYIAKEKEWHLQCCCHGNTLGSSLFSEKPNIPICRNTQWHNCCHGNGTMVVILFLFWCTLLVPSSKNTAVISLELFSIECWAVVDRRNYLADDHRWDFGSFLSYRQNFLADEQRRDFGSI